MKDSTKIFGLLGIAFVLTGVLVIMVIETYQVPEEKLKQFDSYNELKSFIEEGSMNYGGFGMAKDFAVGGVESFAEGDLGVASDAGAGDFSETNVQVQGVDEPDIVKNDGEYIYSISGEKVVITDAFPAEDMEILSELEFEGYISGIFVNDDKLVVFEGGNRGVEGRENPSISYDYGASYSMISQTIVSVSHVSDRENPELEDKYEIDGSYVDARMIDDYVYMISSQYIYQNNLELPEYRINGIVNKISAREISYFNEFDSGYAFTLISAIDVSNGDFENEIFLTGISGNIYVSKENIYLIKIRYLSYEEYFEKFLEVLEEILPEEQIEEIEDIMDSDGNFYEKRRDVQEVFEEYEDGLEGENKEDFAEEFLEEMEDFEDWVFQETQKTIINKISVDGVDIDFQGTGEISGRVLNQFSMDEYDDNFRIATTIGNSWGGDSLNNLYVLDSDLEIIGSVEGLAEGESIYSARFMGEKVYIVTFKKIDPLFVIDLSEPSEPEILGYLKITGYSNYLHPYDENHIIGIGKETGGGSEDFSWYQGLKISVFDVSDVENPVESAKIEIGDRGTDSYVLHNHKAVLFDRERNLLVLPVLLAEVDENSETYPGQDPDSVYGEYVWQGAYVFDIDKNNIEVRGKIAHIDNMEVFDGWGFWGNENLIERSLYMDDVLYTISKGKIKANNLDSLEEIKFVELPFEGFDGSVFEENV